MAKMIVRRKSAPASADAPGHFTSVSLAPSHVLELMASTPGVVSVRIRPDGLSELSDHGYSESEIAELVVPRRTLARRRADNEPLTVEETDKAMRLVRIACQAERVFGDAAKAHRWLRKPKRALNGMTPLAYLASEAGARVVEGMLFRIEHGMFA